MTIRPDKERKENIQGIMCSLYLVVFVIDRQIDRAGKISIEQVTICLKYTSCPTDMKFSPNATINPCNTRMH